MSEARLKATVAATAGLLALGALWWLPQRPAPRPRLPVDRGAPAPPVARADTIRRGEGLVGALRDIGLPDDQARLVLAAAGLRGTAHRLLPLVVRADSAGAPPSDLEFQVADDRIVRVRRAGAGWEASQRRLVWAVDTIAIHATFDRTLVRTFREAATALPVHLRADVAYQVAEAYQHRLDISRDLEDGDSVVALVERRRTPLGAVRLGPLLAAGIRDAGTWIDAVRLASARGRDDYYDARGHPLRTAFLQAPLDVARVSSGFGRRLHPVLGIWHNHAGTDYAAPHGTPVRSVGDGVVIAMGRNGAYGNLLEIRHMNGVVTRYGHLARFARGLRPGRVIQRGAVVAYVGSTGRSTAPHLHFEVMVAGRQREPARTLRAAAGLPLRGAELARYRTERTQLLTRLGVAALLPAASLAQAAVAGGAVLPGPGGHTGRPVPAATAAPARIAPDRGMR